jgi:hypothetical protein
MGADEREAKEREGVDQANDGDDRKQASNESDASSEHCHSRSANAHSED